MENYSKELEKSKRELKELEAQAKARRALPVSQGAIDDIKIIKKEFGGLGHLPILLILTKRLNNTVDKLHKSTKELNRSTTFLIILTVALICLTVILAVIASNTGA